MGSRNTPTGLIAVLCLLMAGQAGAECAPDRVDLRSGASIAQFSVEVADDPAERSQGLMHRDAMPSASGMLFVYPKPQRSQFWMKNTLIPLDMIFADATGTVTAVHENAVPHDETPIDGGTGVRVVLEINGGLAKRMGIAPGSVIRHPVLDQTLAAWTCE